MRAFIDQIEESLATLLLGDDESISVTIPVAWLPAGIREGDVLLGDFRADAAETAAAKRRAQSLMDELGDNP
jgi:hypothetical protein